MSTPLRTGIIGCGNIAGRHAQALAEVEEAQLVAVCDLDPARAIALAQEHGALVARSTDELFSQDLDAVVLCLPAKVHAEVGLTALDAGLHVLVEKPLDIDLEAGERLVRRAAEKSLTLSVVSQHRFHDDVRWLKDVLSSGTLGRPVLANAFSLWQRGQDYYDAAPGRGRHDASEGGVLLNQAVHVTDLLLWLCGPARSVHGRLATLTHEMAAEDTAEVVAQLAHGLATVIASTSVSPQVPERIELRCERGSAVLVGGRVTEIQSADQELVPPSHRPAPPAPDKLEVFRRVHRDFARAVKEGGSPLVRPDEALAVVAFLRAAVESHAAGRTLDLAETRATLDPLTLAD